MSDFRPPTPTYRAQASRVWAWWKSLCAKPQLWGVYTVLFVFMVLFPNGGSVPAEAVRPLGMIGVVVSTLMVLRKWRPEPQGRAQITIPDIVFFGAALVILGGFAPVIYELLDQQASELSAGSAYLLQMVVPGLLVTLLIIFFALATTQGGR